MNLEQTKPQIWYETKYRQSASSLPMKPVNIYPFKPYVLRFSCDIIRIFGIVLVSSHIYSQIWTFVEWHWTTASSLNSKHWKGYVCNEHSVHTRTHISWAPPERRIRFSWCPLGTHLALACPKCWTNFQRAEHIDAISIVEVNVRQQQQRVYIHFISRY